jgi:hypothetical protein
MLAVGLFLHFGLSRGGREAASRKPGEVEARHACVLRFG